MYVFEKHRESKIDVLGVQCVLSQQFMPKFDFYVRLEFVCSHTFTSVKCFLQKLVKLMANGQAVKRT